MAKLTFYGAISGVTGSLYLLETGGKKILLECGLVQGSYEEEQENEQDGEEETSETEMRKTVCHPGVVSMSHWPEEWTSFFQRCPISEKRTLLVACLVREVSYCSDDQYQYHGEDYGYHSSHCG